MKPRRSQFVICLKSFPSAAVQRMSFLKIQLPDPEEFLACAIATKVLQPDIRGLERIGRHVLENGYDWCIENKDSEKDESWWMTVKDIQHNFSWDQFLVGDPVTAKVDAGRLEFGSINHFGGGCHRTIALAALALANANLYQPFKILLHCP